MGKYSAARDLDLSNKIRWYVVANRTGAVIYTDAPDEKFRFIERLSNPEGHLTESELDSDKPGRGFSSASGSIHHGLDRRFTRHEQVAEKFAARINQALELAHREGRYGNMVLVAEPHFLGLLRKALSPVIRRSVSHEVGREYSEGSDAELRREIFRAIESA